LLENNQSTYFGKSKPTLASAVPFRFLLSHFARGTTLDGAPGKPEEQKKTENTCQNTKNNTEKIKENETVNGTETD